MEKEAFKITQQWGAKEYLAIQKTLFPTFRIGNIAQLCLGFLIVFASLAFQANGRGDMFTMFVMIVLIALLLLVVLYTQLDPQYILIYKMLLQRYEMHTIAFYDTFLQGEGKQSHIEIYFYQDVKHCYYDETMVYLFFEKQKVVLISKVALENNFQYLCEHISCEPQYLKANEKVIKPK